MILTNKQFKDARKTFIDEVVAANHFTVPQARYEFDKFLVTNDQCVFVLEEYLNSRRAGAANKIGNVVRMSIYGIFKNAIHFATF